MLPCTAESPPGKQRSCRQLPKKSNFRVFADPWLMEVLLVYVRFTTGLPEMHVLKMEWTIRKLLDIEYPNEIWIIEIKHSTRVWNFARIVIISHPCGAARGFLFLGSSFCLGLCTNGVLHGWMQVSCSSSNVFRRQHIFHEKSLTDAIGHCIC